VNDPLEYIGDVHPPKNRVCFRGLVTFCTNRRFWNSSLAIHNLLQITSGLLLVIPTLSNIGTAVPKNVSATNKNNSFGEKS
jgi:hypothetical protein